MNQRHIFTALAIIAVTGAVSVSNSRAAAWQLDVSDHHVVDRGGLEGAPLLYAQLASGVPPEIQLQYHYISPEMLSQIDGKGAQSHYGMKDASTSSSEARPAETQPYGNYSPNGHSSVSTTGAYREYLSGVPTTPGADPLVQDLSHGLSPR